MPQSNSKRLQSRLKVRKLDLADFSGKRLWFADDPFYTATFTGLSAIFPTGEKFFIQAVLHFRDQITDPELVDEVNDFIRQEANHFKMHQALNHQIREHGVDPDRLASFCATRLNWIQRLTSKKRQLAYTVCCEHFLAAFGHFLLSEPSHLEGLDDTDKAIWIWHAIEEVEHKSVAFDVYQHLGLSRWRLRLCMIEIIFVFTVDMSYLTLRQLYQLKSLSKRKTWRSAARFYLGEKGFLGRLRREIKRFYGSKFHPWDVDDSALIQSYEAKLVGRVQT